MSSTVAPTDPVGAAGPAAGRSRHPLLRFVARRLGGGLLTLLAVSILVFAATEMLPAEPPGAILGRNASPENVAEVRELMGLDDPAVQRYLEWLGGLLTGDLGNSAAGYAQGAEMSIADQVGDKIVNSIILAGIAAVLLVPLAMLLGVIAAVRAGKPSDHLISLGSLAVISLPEFVVGSMLVLIFFSWLDVLPSVSLVPPGTSPLDKPEALVLPVLTLLGVTLAASIRMVRAGMLEALRTDYVEMARLNGFAERTVVRRYALRNALAPSVQVFAQNIQYLVGGIIIVEYLFAYPGLGKELVDAVAVRDVREVQSLAIFIAAFYILVNILADLLVIVLVPRLRTAA